MDESDPRLLSLWPPQPSSPMRAPATVLTSRHLLRMAMACLLQDGFIFRHRFSTFEALLMVIYCLSHNESVDQGWALLGMALNIGIALRCNIDQNSSPIETERRRRCWAGLLTLHTYQGILFRDVDMSYLLNIKAMLPADVNDSDITDEGISESLSRGEPTQMSVMMAKIRLFRLSTQMCRHISGPSRLDQDALHQWDAAIAEEQKKWDSMYMIDGSPNLLEPTQYAYCGVTSLKALHAAVALNSCLQDESVTVDPRYNLDSFREEIKSLALRMKALSDRSRICAKGQQILDHFQSQSGVGNAPMTSKRTQLEDLFGDWADIREWIDTDMINWDLDESLN
ncbi:hypothetical protein FAVG1_07646 [Fusarium avenaceum]|nr:hypothetical protein FAVG1_07646 [Fusarium avenaceum]